MEINIINGSEVSKLSVAIHAPKCNCRKLIWRVMYTNRLLCPISVVGNYPKS